MSDRFSLALIAVGIGGIVLFTVASAAVAPPVDRAARERVKQPTWIGSMGAGHDGAVYRLNESGAITWQFKKDAISYNDITKINQTHVLATYQEASNRCPKCARTGYRIIDIRSKTIVSEWSTPTPKTLNSEVHDADYVRSTGEVVLVDMAAERIVAINTSTEEAVWEWRASEYYDAPPSPARTDWLHINDIDVIDNGTYLISVRNMNQLLIVKRGSGVVEVINENRDSDVLNEQHNPQWLGDGAVLVADSENDRVVELHRNRDGEWSVAWAIEGANGVQFDWPRDADRLQNGHTLIMDTRNARLVEVTKNGSVVWTTSIPEQTYDADRGGQEYPAGPRYNASGMVVNPHHGVPIEGVAKLYGAVRHVVPLPYWIGEWHVAVTIVGLVLALTGVVGVYTAPKEAVEGVGIVCRECGSLPQPDQHKGDAVLECPQCDDIKFRRLTDD